MPWAGGNDGSGGSGINLGTFSGLTAAWAVGLTPTADWAVEGSGFLLEQRTDFFSATGNASDARPFMIQAST